jgi:Restriction endonuclease
MYLLYLLQLTPQQRGSNYELQIKKILDDNSNFITRSISCRQYDYDDKKMLFFGDGGIDLYVNYFDMDIYIQCKSFASKLGPNTVRELNGIRRKNDIVCCLTNENGYSKAARIEAKQYNVLLTNKNNICETLINYYNTIYKNKKNKRIEYKIDSIESLIINNCTLTNLKGCTINIFN